jgi:hypothetical protein
MKGSDGQTSRQFRSKIAHPVLVFSEFTKQEQGTVLCHRCKRQTQPLTSPLVKGRGEESLIADLRLLF